VIYQDLTPLRGMDPIDQLIAAIAVPQNGNITRRQLLELGLSERAIDRRIRKGLLHRVFPGVYHVGTPARTPVERATAAVLACGGDDAASLSCSSGMTHWGFWRRWDQPFEVTLLRGDRRPKGITVHRSATLDRRQTIRHHGVRVTKPARTLFDMAPRLHGERLDRAVNTALVSPWLSRGRLIEQLKWTPTHPGAKLMLPYIVTGDGPTRSDWERELPPFCRTWDLPQPIMGYKTGPNRTADAFWELNGKVRGIVIELDSLAYHLNALAFKGDRARDKDHLALRLPTVRIVWEEMHETPRQEAERLHRIIRAWS
jgi:putative AbiEi antitoxin of type IV toxin-antitoxin system